MMASRLNHREHVIPAQTDHLEDKGGVIGLRIQRPIVGLFQDLKFDLEEVLPLIATGHTAFICYSPC
jgi:hypothetical protein